METLWTLIARSGHTYNTRDIMRARTTAIRAIWTQTGTYKTCNLDTATPALLTLQTCKTSAWTFKDRQRTPRKALGKYHGLQAPLEVIYSTSPAM